MATIPRPAVLLATGAIALVPLAGCGDDDNSDSTTEESASTAATTESTAAAGGGGAETIDVSETDFALSPANPTVKAGEVTFNATNDGQVTHSLEIEGPGEESELPADLAPGESGSVTVDLSKPGTYEWYCPIDDHKGMGMEGEITVQ
jgi:plastocyanin